MDEPAKSNRVEDGMHLDFSKRMSYGDYLRLDQLLTAQAPLSNEHDEMMFIVAHHVQELWIRLSIHELTFAMQSLSTDNSALPSRHWPGSRASRSSLSVPGMFCPR